MVNDNIMLNLKTNLSHLFFFLIFCLNFSFIFSAHVEDMDNTYTGKYEDDDGNIFYDAMPIADDPAIDDSKLVTLEDPSTGRVLDIKGPYLINKIIEDRLGSLEYARADNKDAREKAWAARGMVWDSWDKKERDERVEETESQIRIDEAAYNKALKAKAEMIKRFLNYQFDATLLINDFYELQHLVKSGQLNLKTTQMPLLSRAIEEKSVNGVKLLLDNGADPNAKQRARNLVVFDAPLNSLCPIRATLEQFAKIKSMDEIGYLIEILTLLLDNPDIILTQDLLNDILNAEVYLKTNNTRATLINILIEYKEYDLLSLILRNSNMFDHIEYYPEDRDFLITLDQLKASNQINIARSLIKLYLAKNASPSRNILNIINSILGKDAISIQRVARGHLGRQEASNKYQEELARKKEEINAAVKSLNERLFPGLNLSKSIEEGPRYSEPESRPKATQAGALRFILNSDKFK